MPDVSAALGTGEVPEDAIIVESVVVRCDGGGEPLGHPRVFLRIESDGRVICPYCSRCFVLAPGADARTGH